MCLGIHAQTDTAQARILMDQALDHMKQKNFRKSVELHEKARKHLANGPWSEYLLCQFRLAACYRKLDKSETGDRIVDDTYAHLQANLPALDTTFLECYARAAKHFKDQYQPAIQREWLQKRLALLMELSPTYDHELITCHAQLGYACQNAGDTAEVLGHFQQSLQWSLDLYGDQHEKAANAYARIAWYHRIRGNQEGRLRYIEKGLEVYNRLEDTLNLQVAYLERQMASIIMHRGDYRSAIAHGQRSARICEANGLDNSRAQQRLSYALATLAHCHMKTNNIDEAIDYLKLAMTANRRGYGPNNINQALYHANLGGMYMSLHDSAMCRAHCDSALEVIKINGLEESHRAGYAYSEVSENLCGLGNLEEARAIALKGIAVSTGQYPDHHAAVLTPTLTLAKCDMQEGAFHSALRIYQRAITLLNQSTDTDLGELTYCYLRTGECYQEMGDPDSALRYFQHGLMMVCDGFNDSSVYANPAPNDFLGHATVVNHLLAKANTFQSMGGPVDDDIQHQAFALETFLQAFAWADHFRTNYISSAAKSDLLAEITPAFIQAIGLASHLHETTGEGHYLDVAHELMERSKAFQLKRSFDEKALHLLVQQGDSLFEREYQLKVDIAYYEGAHSDAHSASSTREKLIKAREELSVVKEKLKAKYRDYHQIQYDFEVAGTDQIRQDLEADDVMVLFTVSDSTVFIEALSKEDRQLSGIAMDRALVDLIEDYYLALSDYDLILNDPGEAYLKYVNAAYPIYDRLFPDGCKEMMTGKDRIIIVPDGMLHHLNFEALLTSAADQENRDYGSLAFFGQQFRIQYAPSATLLLKMDQMRSVGEGYLGFAPTYESGALAQASQMRSFRAVPDHVLNLVGTEAEVLDAAAFLGGDTRLGTEATESAFKHLAHRYQVLHLAMHAFLSDENAYQSKLVFAQVADSVEDNFLNVYEILGLNLSAELSVLSACHTGYGTLLQGEGPVSLAQAFAYAGCPSVVMSQWQADDQATSFLMKRFFMHLSEGLDKSKALQQAKLDYLAQADPAQLHPYYWANFVVVGSDKPLAQNTFPWGWAAGVILIVGACVYVLRRRNRSLKAA